MQQRRFPNYNRPKLQQAMPAEENRSPASRVYCEKAKKFQDSSATEDPARGFSRSPLDEVFGEGLQSLHPFTSRANPGCFSRPIGNLPRPWLL
jgi:hypothetical protein